MAAPLIVAASLAVLAAAPPETPMAIARKVNAEYKRAMLAKDIAHFEKNSTPDFAYISASGEKASKKQALEGIKQSFAMTKRVDLLEMKIVSARRAEGGVLVTSDCKMVAQIAMGKQNGNLVTTFRDEVLVVPMGKGWAYKRVKILKDDTKIDGKPVKM